ncbi:prenyltransferase, putative [Trypanosoma brucei gambiense DAL972]|uniref:4-hydroxybenzoate polyprenyltransferase, mitochondrial n=2 Tax=Trypanosoma brucei TaxID=5691 RepID=D0A8C8_TRYB9|nr:prenyltransferase, putative [Trypanosoma brucei gambiense DAL972]AGE02998.1 Coq2p [Trypanosoma brucei brucei]CBH17929.1 prenyltransferase, putative [Trypanosoma brucei gambiense DAL972]|eukprot:XP_011780193.1 prenyltransferase, putative [Trypanosoma brucei gambiense DAL972]
MLRRTIFLGRVTRSWTKGSIVKASAHFPDSVRADPAERRNEDSSPKESRTWSLHDGPCSEPLHVPKHIQWATQKVRVWGQLMRVDKAAAINLLLQPCYWGASLAVTRAIVWEGADPVVLFAPFIPVHLIVLFGAGAFLARGAGCIINDMCDRKFDRMVERTKTRPLASGVVSMKEASGLLITVAGFALVIALNLSPVALASAVALAPIAAVYPLMKRITYMPQLVLGLCFNGGIFVGYAAVLNRIDLAVTLPIYCSAVVWTVLYDTIYAYQDRADDLKCGVKSSAILIGDRKHILTFMILPIGMGILISGLMVSQSLPFYIGVLCCVWYLQGVVDNVNIYDAWSCGIGFRRNVRFAILVTFSLCLGNVLWALASEHQPEKDAASNAISEKSALMKFLLLNKEAEPMSYSVQDIRWVDRFAHPAFVAAQKAQHEGEEKTVVVPAWMRREYLGENVGTIMRFFGVDEEAIQTWQKWWYAQLDHYNMFSSIAV